VQLVDAIDRPKIAIMVVMSFFCGLRISEVCKIKIEDADFQRNRVKIVDAKNSRRFASGYGKDRYVPIPLQLISHLRKWIDLISGGKCCFHLIRALIAV